MMKQNRQSNFECLRIVAMVMIITTHCISSSKAFSVFQPNTIQYVILSFVQTLANYGVNLFVLITGWFMIEKTSISVRKVARILLDVAFYGIIIYLISVLIGINVLSLRGLIKAAFPLLFGYRWFVLAYCVLFVLIPYINAMLRHLTQAQYGTLLIICFVLFSVWPTFLPNPPIDHYGYSFLHLIFMYILAGYARKYIHDISSGCNLLLLLICLSCKLVLYLLPSDTVFLSTALNYKGAYNSVFNVLSSFSIFLLFSKFSFSSKIINVFASSAFAVFLIHGDYNIMDFLFNNMLQIGNFYSHWYWCFPLIVTIILIYLVCASIDLLKRKLFDKPEKKLLDLLPIFNYTISAMEE